MTEEPTYYFVPGSGWVPRNFEVHEFSHSGKRFALEVRKPEFGEPYIAIWSATGVREIIDTIIRYRYQPHEYSVWQESTNFGEPITFYVYKEVRSD